MYGVYIMLHMHAWDELNVTLLITVSLFFGITLHQVFAGMFSKTTSTLQIFILLKLINVSGQFIRVYDAILLPPNGEIYKSLFLLLRQT